MLCGRGHYILGPAYDVNGQMAVHMLVSQVEAGVNREGN